jgi:hypothetical protein
MRILMFWVLGAGLLLLSSQGAEAKPKKVSNGCTASQIQSAAAKDCIDKMESDVAHNRRFYHALYCSSSGKMLCCEYDSKTGEQADHSCTVVGKRRPSDAAAQKPGSDAGVVRDPKPEPVPRNAAPVGKDPLLR